MIRRLNGVFIASAIGTNSGATMPLRRPTTSSVATMHHVDHTEMHESDVGAVIVQNGNGCLVRGFDFHFFHQFPPHALAGSRAGWKTGRYPLPRCVRQCRLKTIRAAGSPARLCPAGSAGCDRCTESKRRGSVACSVGPARLVAVKVEGLRWGSHHRQDTCRFRGSGPEIRQALPEPSVQNKALFLLLPLVSCLSKAGSCCNL